MSKKTTAVKKERRAYCGNCGWRGDVSELGKQLDETPDLQERLDPGETLISDLIGDIGHFVDTLPDEERGNQTLFEMIGDAAGMYRTECEEENTTGAQFDPV